MLEGLDQYERKVLRGAATLSAIFAPLIGWSVAVGASARDLPIRIPATATPWEPTDERVKHFSVPKEDVRLVDCGGQVMRFTFDFDRTEVAEPQPNGVVRVSCSGVGTDYPVEVIVS